MIDDTDDWLVIRITPEAAQAITDAIVGRHPTWREMMLAMRHARTGRPNPYAKRERNDEIKRLRANGMRITQIARLYGISNMRVRAILNNETRR